VAALERAVAFEEVNHLAGGVGEDLYLDVAGAQHRLLQEDRGVAERGGSLAHRRAERLPQVLAGVDAAHPAPAAARHGLHEDGEADLLGVGDEALDVVGRLGGPQHRDPGDSRGPQRLHLVAREPQYLGGRADEGDPGVGSGLGEAGVLGEEAVAGVDGVRAGLPCHANDLVHVKVGADGVALLPDLVGLVRLLPVDRIAVVVGIDRHGPRPQLGGGAEAANGDLAAVGDQDLAEHRTPRFLALAAPTLPGLAPLPGG